MYPFRNILFPTDFSLHAHAALKYAAAFARESGGRVLLLSVLDAKVPANLTTMPEYVFENHENNWLLQIRSLKRIRSFSKAIRRRKSPGPQWTMKSI